MKRYYQSLWFLSPLYSHRPRIVVATVVLCLCLSLQLLSIEISDGNKRDMPIFYKVCAEVLIPALNSTDVMSIFEEHRICRQLGVLGPHEFHEVM